MSLQIDEERIKAIVKRVVAELREQRLVLSPAEVRESVGSEIRIPKPVLSTAEVSEILGDGVFRIPLTLLLQRGSVQASVLAAPLPPSSRWP